MTTVKLPSMKSFDVNADGGKSGFCGRIGRIGRKAKQKPMLDVKQRNSALLYRLALLITSSAMMITRNHFPQVVLGICLYSVLAIYTVTSDGQLLGCGSEHPNDKEKYTSPLLSRIMIN